MGKNVDPESGIWHMSIAKKRHKTDYMLTGAIGTYFDPPESVADLGCGLGEYCKVLNAYGWPVLHGFEGTKGIHSIALWKSIFIMDLSLPLENLTGCEMFKHKYDFVLCLEVGEHIPPEREQVFIDNICFFANKDIVLSWAVPGQYSASGHVNCRSNDYVISELAKRGYILDNDMTKKLRKAAYFNWFENTIMVFREGSS
jgi:2-polyprenyl-3-methyl-5-hydroxy-6-metoxy-1,4-benzoquinol methylase